MNHPAPVNYPLASVVIPALNEEHYIQRCLESLILQDYPPDKLEILVVDGNSQDRTRTAVEEFRRNHRNVRLVDNPRQIIPAALNRGIQEARGEVILRADAHTVYDRRYVAECVRLLMNTEASNVGGVIIPVGDNLISQTIALAVSSPFGVGNAYHRFATRQMWVDTVAFGCWRKATLLALGGYNEKYLVNEDYELNYRLRLAGGRILLSPSAKSYYFSRPSVWGLFSQYFRYGKGKVKMLMDHPDSLVYRQVVAPLFVVSLIVSFLLLPFNLWPFLAVVGSYFLVNLFFSAMIGNRHGWKHGFLIPLVFFTVHSAWGLGFLNGLRFKDLTNLLQALKRKLLKGETGKSYQEAGLQ